MDKIPYDIIYLLFNTIYYEDTYSLALVNKNYYDSNLYLISLTFALIQVMIEVYYFYKKDRYKRL